MRIIIRKGTIDLHPILTHIGETIREKIRKGFYCNKRKHYVNDLQKSYMVEIKIKRLVRGD